MRNESYYRDLKHRLEQEPHGNRQSLINAATEFLGVSHMTIYRNLKKLGYSDNRKTRADKGDSQIGIDELKIIASLIRQSERANHKSLMPIKVAIEIAYENGQINEMYNEGTVARLLRENQLSQRHMQQATPHIKLKTAYPNEMWELDPSICILYYLKDGNKMAVMDKDKFYKNKLENVYKIANERVFRYVVVDHYSGAFYCKYYMARGENQETLFDFLMTAMGEKDKLKNPFEGVPTMLYWDKGSANQSHMIQNLLNQLNIKHAAHIAGNSRAKGLVEKTNDIIERHFEGRLYLGQHQIQSIDDLNLYCEIWQRGFQSSQRYAHSRHKMPRFTAWRRITSEQLITRPPIDVCKMLLSDKPAERLVKGNYNIHFEGRKYNLSGVDNIAIGSKVGVKVNPYDYPNIRVSHPNSFGEMVTYDIAPLTQDDIGFDSDAIPATAMMDGHFHTAKLTTADKNRQELDELAYGTRDQAHIDRIRNTKSQPAFDGKMDAFTYLKAEHDKPQTLLHMPKQGTPLDIGEPALQKVRVPKRPSPTSVERTEEALPVLQFIQWFVKKHGVIDGMADKIREQYADGVKQSDYERIAEQLINPQPKPTESEPQPQLKVI
ncbi:integrase catalytic domain-containing protein [Psychrobacter sp. I-STPA10]|uniref:integrase catalytic domain-containing protein n=1 Tax=Psychrobacter sp. I-STPA10 TaxID=2585769 RepID=UPI001E49D063|nr:transposase family protein [Psychrobacter sp. I-STPA10]